VTASGYAFGVVGDAFAGLPGQFSGQFAQLLG